MTVTENEVDTKKQVLMGDFEELNMYCQDVLSSVKSLQIRLLDQGITCELVDVLKKIGSIETLMDELVDMSFVFNHVFDSNGDGCEDAIRGCIKHSLDVINAKIGVTKIMLVNEDA